MESLALMVAIIVSPAMYGGPLALALTFWKSDSISQKRRFVIKVLTVFSSASGVFLLVQSVSRGGTILGLIGVVTSLLTIMRLRRLK